MIRRNGFISNPDCLLRATLLSFAASLAICAHAGGANVAAQRIEVDPHDMKGVDIAVEPGAVNITLDFDLDEDGFIVGDHRRALAAQRVEDAAPGEGVVAIRLLRPSTAIEWVHIPARHEAMRNVEPLADDAAGYTLLVPVAVETDADGQPTPGAGQWRPAESRAERLDLRWYLDDFSEFGAETLTLAVGDPDGLAAVKAKQEAAEKAEPDDPSAPDDPVEAEQEEAEEPEEEEKDEEDEPGWFRRLFGG